MSPCIAQKNGLIKVKNIKGTTHIILTIKYCTYLHREICFRHILGDDLKAKKMSEKVRVLCWVMTAPENHDKKAKHVKATWGRRCNVLIFMSSKEGTIFKKIP